MTSRKPPEDWNDLGANPGDEAPRWELPPPPRQRRLLLPTLFVLSLAALAGGWLGPLNPWPAGPGRDELAQGGEAARRLAEKAVQDYARRNGRYPAKLEEAIALPPGLHLAYVPRDSSFELRLDAGGGSTP